MTLSRRCASILSFLTCAALPVFAQIVTSQYDNLRTGATLNEKILTPKNVNSRQFGKLGAFKVDGPVYAQPLYVPNLDVPGQGRHNVLYVATEHDTVYAFDADRPGEAPLWKVSFLDHQRSIEAVTGDEVVRTLPAYLRALKASNVTTRTWPAAIRNASGRAARGSSPIGAPDTSCR
jgi:hypothetical protein